MAEKSSGVDLAERLDGKRVNFAIHLAGFTETGVGSFSQLRSSTGTSFSVGNTQFAFIVEAEKVRNCTYDAGRFSFYLPGNILFTFQEIFRMGSIESPE